MIRVVGMDSGVGRPKPLEKTSCHSDSPCRFIFVCKSQLSWLQWVEKSFGNVCCRNIAITALETYLYNRKEDFNSACTPRAVACLGIASTHRLPLLLFVLFIYNTDKNTLVHKFGTKLSSKKARNLRFRRKTMKYHEELTDSVRAERDCMWCYLVTSNRWYCLTPSLRKRQSIFMRFVWDLDVQILKNSIAHF